MVFQVAKEELITGSGTECAKRELIIKTNDISSSHFPESSTDPKSLSCNFTWVEVHLTGYG